ncbi:MAG: 3-oxoacyl-ACP reductase FabG [Actinomycetota bacterium]
MPALVTGASKGIGARIAVALAREGYRLAVGYRSDAVGAGQTAGDILAAGGEAIPVQIDVSRHDAVERAFGEVEDRWGPVGVLVNNAGQHRGARLHKLSLDDWEAVLDTNLTGAMHTARRAIGGMLARQFGRIVNIGSVVSLTGFPGDAAYGASKAGLVGLTTSLAVELGPAGITVNLVLPGYVDTDMTRQVDSKAIAGIVDRIPLRRPASSDEIAAAVSFLVTAGTYVNGAVLAVDGGLLASSAAAPVSGPHRPVDPSASAPGQS